LNYARLLRKPCSSGFPKWNAFPDHTTAFDDHTAVLAVYFFTAVRDLTLALSKGRGNCAQGQKNKHSFDDMSILLLKNLLQFGVLLPWRRIRG
jgi:hypothetical protein